MVRRMHPVLASHVVKVHAYLRSISFALSLSLLSFVPFHPTFVRKYTPFVNTRKGVSLSLSLTECQPRSTTSSCTKKRGDRGN